jgi:hypothetical protein
MKLKIIHTVDGIHWHVLAYWNSEHHLQCEDQAKEFERRGLQVRIVEFGGRVKL